MENKIKDTEKKLEYYGSSRLEDVVKALLDAKKRGEKCYFNFNGVVLHSDTVTMNDAFLKVTGRTKAQYDQFLKEHVEESRRRQEADRIREEAIQIKVLQARQKGVTPITQETVVPALKFIAENQDISQEELAEGLLAMGCNYTMKELRREFHDNIGLFEGLSHGELSCGASVVINARDTMYGRDVTNDKFLSSDNPASIYNYVRLVTGDKTYTKEYVDSLKSDSITM